MFISADQLLAHAIGDYVIQSDWMANEKTKKSTAALVHVLTYAIPFLILFPSASIWALLFIVGTHFIMDRWRLARYICYAKNFLGPRSGWFKWEDCVGTGYHKDRPPWMSVWLMIVADNVFHVVCNGIALKYLS